MNHPYRWVIVAAGGLLGCVAIGAMFSLPVFLRPMAQDTGWSVTGISTAMTIGFLAMAAASMVWGGLSDKFGPRPVVLTGSAVLAASLALASRAGSLIEFQLLFGLLVGAATAAVFAPMMACVTGWFDTQRGLAVSLVSAGMGICARRSKSDRDLVRPNVDAVKAGGDQTAVVGTGFRAGGVAESLRHQRLHLNRGNAVHGARALGVALRQSSGDVVAVANPMFG
jgi:hypothetical protein